MCGRQGRWAGARHSGLHVADLAGQQRFCVLLTMCVRDAAAPGLASAMLSAACQQCASLLTNSHGGGGVGVGHA